MKTHSCEIGKLKQRILKEYGEFCTCCGESNPIFLTLDHIDNNGAAQRKSIFGKKVRGGYNFYLWLKRNNFPTGLQTLCFNCNQGRYINKGICPHKEKGKSNDQTP